MFQLNIQTENDAFAPTREGVEIGRIIRTVADALDLYRHHAALEGNVRDINGNTCGSWTFTPDSIEANELEVPGGPPKLFQPQQNTLIDGWIPFIFDEVGEYIKPDPNGEPVNYSTREEAQRAIDEFNWAEDFPRYLPEEFRVAFIAESFGDTLEHAELLGWEDIYPDASDPKYDGNMADGIEDSAIEFIESQGLVVIHPEV